MVLVFILFAIFILLLVCFTMVILSTLQIEIKNIRIRNKRKDRKKRIEENYEIVVSLRFLGKIPIIWFRLNAQRIKKLYDSKQLQKIDIRQIEKKLPSHKEIIEMVKRIKIRVTKLNLKIAIGTEDAVITSYLIAGIASVIGVIVPHVAKENIKDCYYVVKPIYQDKNEYDISLESIISIKIVHIIYSMLNFVKKGREKYERTSNRRSYAYRYE